MFRLIGPALPALLQEACAVDLSPDVVADLAIVPTAIAGDRVILARRDHAGLPGVTLAVVRDDAEHLWDSLVELGHPFGIVPVGGLAVAPPAMAQAVAAGAAGAAAGAGAAR